MTATTPDLFGEKLISFSRAAKLIPPFRGAHTAPSTIYRWCIDGCRLPDGSKLRLESMRVGGRTCTSEEALRRFLVALTAAHQPGEPLPAPRSPAKRKLA